MKNQRLGTISERRRSSGSALAMVLSFIVLLSCLFFLCLQTVHHERSTAHAFNASYQASLAADSGLAVAVTQLSLASSNNPVFLVGKTNVIADSAPVLVIGESNLTNTAQLMPLISGGSATLSDEKNYRVGLIDLNEKNHLCVSGRYDEGLTVTFPWVIAYGLFCKRGF